MLGASTGVQIDVVDTGLRSCPVISVLALDSAWTAGEPSGVALVQDSADGWSCVAVAPSCAQFIDFAQGTPLDWSARPSGNAETGPELLEAARELLGGRTPDVITVDMPVATAPITGRRRADALVSQAFGARGCGTHSPSTARPGAIGRDLSVGLLAAGFPLATCTTEGLSPRLVEVYPHPALLVLMAVDYRVPYKVSRAHRYWPALTAPARRRRLAGTWREIHAMLARTISECDMPIPTEEAASGLPGVALKRYEDALDALICAWVGIQYLAGRCDCYGDDTAAIWVPAAFSA